MKLLTGSFLGIIIGFFQTFDATRSPKTENSTSSKASCEEKRLYKAAFDTLTYSPKVTNGLRYLEGKRTSKKHKKNTGFYVSDELFGNPSRASSMCINNTQSYLKNDNFNLNTLSDPSGKYCFNVYFSNIKNNALECWIVTDHKHFDRDDVNIQTMFGKRMRVVFCVEDCVIVASHVSMGLAN